MIRLGGCLRVPRWALAELALTGRVVRLCDAEIPTEPAVELPAEVFDAD